MPQDAIKFTVEPMIVAFSIYWTKEVLGGPESWPLSDWTPPLLGAFYLLAGLELATAMRTRIRRRTA